MLSSQRYVVIVEGVCPESMRLRIWRAVAARQRGGVSEFAADGIAEADDVVLGGYEEDGVGRDPEDVVLLVTVEEFVGAVEPGCEPADRLGTEGVGSEDVVVGDLFLDGGLG